MERVVIEKLSVTDVSEVIALGLQTEEFQTWTDSAPSISKKTLEGWINNDDGVTLAAKVGDELVGYVLGFYNPRMYTRYVNLPDFGCIDFLVVKQGYRRMGVGSALLEKAADEFRNKSGGRCDHLYSFVEPDNKATLGLIEKHGFRMLSDRRNI